MIEIDDPNHEGPTVNMISGGPTMDGTLKNSRKAYAWEVLQVVGGPSQKARTEATISFKDNNLENVKFPHEATISFLKMGYTDSQLTLSDMSVYGFNGVGTKVEGII